MDTILCILKVVLHYFELVGVSCYVAVSVCIHLSYCLCCIYVVIVI